MKDKYNQLLSQMGIDQYKIKSPYSLKRNFNFFLNKIYLVIVSKTSSIIQYQFVKDVFLTLNLKEKQVLVITPKKLELLPKYCYIIWQIGLDTNFSKLNKLDKISDVFISTSSLNKLMNSVKEKRFLWKNLYNM